MDIDTEILTSGYVIQNKSKFSTQSVTWFTANVTPEGLLSIKEGFWKKNEWHTWFYKGSLSRNCFLVGMPFFSLKGLVTLTQT